MPRSITEDEKISTLNHLYSMERGENGFLGVPGGVIVSLVGLSFPLFASGMPFCKISALIFTPFSEKIFKGKRGAYLFD